MKTVLARTALLRLFNAVHVDSKEPREFSESVLKRTTKNGYVLHPAIEADNKLLNTIEKIVGVSGDKANAAFHKSWTIVQDSSMEDLVTQQMIHYITTYGFQNLGIFREDAVYIPDEVLEIPEVHGISLTTIKAFDSQEIIDAIVNLGSGIALAQDTLNDIMVIVGGSKFDSEFVGKINNRELKTLLFDFYGIYPTEPLEFLRYVVARLTDESLLIKNNELIEKLKGSNGKFLDELMKHAPKDLASIFFRFKPIFLAMRSVSRNKGVFNRLRKQADKMHKPMSEDYLNSVTSQIKNGKLSLDTLTKKISKAIIFRKIRLANALSFRLNSPEAIVYRVRNGRGWASEFDWSSGLEADTKDALAVVVDSIIEDVRKNVEGKTIYIPQNVHYALPATEKQFTGNMPTGTYICVPEDLIVGIHWVNTDRSIDLDLSMISESGKIGWDGEYRSKDKGVLFSGDMTNAPKPGGATELFYIKRGQSEARLLTTNFYNYMDDEVECKILVAQEKAQKFGDNYMVDPNNIIASANVNISKKQNVLGLVTNVGGENRVYFAHVSVGNSISVSNDVNSTNARKYLVASLENSICMDDILVEAGADVVMVKPVGDFIDLSPEALDKTTIIDLIKDQSGKEV